MTRRGSSAPIFARSFAAAVKDLGDGAVEDSRKTAVFLAMGRDRADGRISLVPITNTLSIEWNVQKNLPLYDSATRLVTDLTEALGGKLELNPLWKRLHVPVSVHNLGGCIMADDSANGVTSATGEVYGYPRLYVLDGAILPRAVGVNPRSTIAAVAERNVETIVREMTGNPEWRAPEWSAVTPIYDPVSAIVIPPRGVAPLRSPSLGIMFKEVMKGFVAKGYAPEGDYAGAAKAGLKGGTVADLALTIAAPDSTRSSSRRHTPGSRERNDPDSTVSRSPRGRG